VSGAIATLDARGNCRAGLSRNEGNRLNKPQTSGSQHRALTEGSVGHHLFRLTGFMLLGFVSVMGANLMESLYISQVGTLELAALGFTFPLVMMMQGVTMGLGVGASSVVARKIGAHAWPEARILISHAIWMVIVFTMVLSLLVYWGVGSIFALLGADPAAEALASEYMALWLFGLPFFAVAMVGSSLMRAAGDATKPSYLMTVSALIQVGLGPLLIFGFGSFEGLGMPGAAWSFLVARFVSFLMYIYYMRRDGLLVPGLAGFGDSSRSILHVGLPAIAANLISPVSMTVITRLLASHGTAVVAGFSVASRVETMFAMFMWALSMSIAPIIGQNWGAGHFDRVRTALRSAYVFALVWGLFSFLVLFTAGPWLLHWVNDDPEVIAAATTYLSILPLGMGLMGVIATSTSSFNALGKPSPPLAISIVQMLFLSVPLAILGNALFGYTGLLFGSVLSIGLTAILSYVWLRRTIKRRLSVGEVDAAPVG